MGYLTGILIILAFSFLDVICKENERFPTGPEILSHCTKSLLGLLLIIAGVGAILQILDYFFVFLH